MVEQQAANFGKPQVKMRKLAVPAHCRRGRGESGGGAAPGSTAKLRADSATYRTRGNCVHGSIGRTGVGIESSRVQPSHALHSSSKSLQSPAHTAV